MPDPESVTLGHDVDPDRISGEGVVIHPGCRITGSSTLICRGVSLGAEGPVTMDDCFVGPDATLKGGYFQKACFLAGASAGSGAHVREGSIFEEQASIAHTVGVKQTILFPYVTLGSLINFCDCFMSGGTDGKNHSEVGSSYIHFNYTPNQDKATPSMMGDVPRGVMLKQPPIFLGGQGGLVGPCRLAFGTVVAAGTICRKDEMRPGRLIFEARQRGGNIPYTPGFYRSIRRTMRNNLYYIANLTALGQWYRHIRRRFVGPSFPEELYLGLVETLTANIDERIRRLGEFCAKLPESAKRYKTVSRKTESRACDEQYETAARWPELEELIRRQSDNVGDSELKRVFEKQIQNLIQNHGRHYVDVIRRLNPGDADTGTRWLDTVVASQLDQFGAVLPFMGHLT